MALRALLAGVHQLTGATYGGVRLPLDAERLVGPCRTFYFGGVHDGTWQIRATLPGSNVARVCTSGRGEYTADLRAEARIGDEAARLAMIFRAVGSSLTVPLRAGGRVIGTLHADASRPNAFRAAQLRPLQVLADHAGGAVEQARLRTEAAAQLQAHLAADARFGVMFQESPIPTFTWRRQGGAWILDGFNAAAERFTSGGFAVFLGHSAVQIYPDLPEMAELFTKFYRASNRFTEEVGGAGLGLAITSAGGAARRDDHGGRRARPGNHLYRRLAAARRHARPLERRPSNRGVGDGPFLAQRSPRADFDASVALLRQAAVPVDTPITHAVGDRPCFSATPPATAPRSSPAPKRRRGSAHSAESRGGPTLR
jgi:hypothetical protein